MESRATPRRRSPLVRREFRLYFAGNLVSNTGNWINNVTLGVYMLELTQSSFWVGITAMGLFLPVLVLALPVGALADRGDRLSILSRSQVFCGGLAILLTILAATGGANRYSVAAISFGLGVGVAFAIPTMQSLIPSLVPPEELADAIRFNALTFNLARVAGPMLAATVLVSLGPVWAFALNAFSFAVLVVALRAIGRPPYPPRTDAPPGSVRQGLAYAWRHVPTRSALAGIVAIGLALDPIGTLSPALASELGTPPAGAGWMVAAWGSGAVATIVAGGAVIRRVTQHGLGWTGLLVLGVGTVAMGAAPTFAAALAAALVVGAGYITAAMAFTTTIQQSVPEEFRGRVSALWTVAFLGPRAFAAIVDGAIADAAGVRVATVAFGVLALGGALLLRRATPAAGEPLPPPV